MNDHSKKIHDSGISARYLSISGFRAANGTGIIDRPP